MLNYIRVACAVPPVSVGDVQKNTRDICAFIAQADEKGCDLVVFPELALTGYSCGDLFFQHSLQHAVKEGLAALVHCSAEHPAVTAVVGMPAMIDGQLYNCGAVIVGGSLRALSVKTFAADHDVSCESRWFAQAEDLTRTEIDAAQLGLDESYSVSVGSELLVRLGDGAMLGVEICEDLWSPVAPSSMLAVNGAEIIVNLSASHEIAGKRTARLERICRQSVSTCSIYAFCSAGMTESTQDLVFGGHSVIVQDGAVLAQNERLTDTDYMIVCDADLDVIRSLRGRNTTFRKAQRLYGRYFPVQVQDAGGAALRGDGTLQPQVKLPFIPQDRESREKLCAEVFELQVTGLMQRLKTIGAKAVVGISGGLDSTLALLVAVEAVKRLGRPANDVHGITMPCFGTSDRTYQNAWELMRTLGITAKEVNIRDAVTTHFRDIGHDPDVHDTTYENSQARERTQILMDYAGEVGGIVIGTGDLSELALGWCTYNGDHMSMYGVNASVPKTLIRWIIDAISQKPAFAASKAVLMDILDTPISPELLPPDAQGKISQQTEDIVGPYALHDFFLYHMVRHGFTPTKIFTMACRAFQNDFDTETVKKWLKNFYRRFFTQQFKRNCQPDGAKTGIVGLGSRGDWRMASDASARLWLAEIDTL